MENDKKYMRFLASCFAMTGLLEGYQYPDEFTEQHLARTAVGCADALLEELEREKDIDDGIASVVTKRRRSRNNSGDA
jgi:hypothetical protein